MPLPPSGPISINDIRIELGQAQGNNSLRALSNLAGFSPPDAMSEFYGYPPAPPYNTIQLVNNPTSSEGEACSLDGEEFTVYFSGSGGTPACPATTVVLFTDPGLTTRFDGQDLWWKSYQCNARYYILRSGFIEGQSPC